MHTPHTYIHAHNVMCANKHHNTTYRLINKAVSRSTAEGGRQRLPAIDQLTSTPTHQHTNSMVISVIITHNKL